MHINRAVADDHVVAPYGIQDFVAEKNPAWFEGQQVEQFKFFFCEDQFLFIHFHNKSFGVNRHVPDIENPHFSFIQPAEQGIDPAQEYFRTDGFAHIVIGAGLQSTDLGAFVVHSCQENNQSFFESRLGAEQFTDLYPGLFGHHHIQHHKVGIMPAGFFEGFIPILGGNHLIPFIGQVVLQDLENVRFVIRNQYFPGVGFHGGKLFAQT